MKSAYEKALERFGKTQIIKLTDEQKEKIAELESLYKAKIAHLSFPTNSPDEYLSAHNVRHATSIARRLRYHGFYLCVQPLLTDKRFERQMHPIAPVVPGSGRHIDALNRRIGNPYVETYRQPVL